VAGRLSRSTIPVNVSGAPRAKNGELVPVSWDGPGHHCGQVQGLKGRKDRSLDNLQDPHLTMSELVAVFQGRMGAYVGVLEPTLAISNFRWEVL